MSKCWLGLLLPLLCASVEAQRNPPEPNCDADREVEYIAALRDPGVRESDRDFLVEAILCAGKLRSIASVNALIDLLDFRYTFPWDGTPLFYLVPATGRRLAAGALAEIGAPALPALTRALGKGLSDPEAELAVVQAMLLIFDGDSEKTLNYLQKAAVGAASEDERERMLEGAALLRPEQASPHG